MKTSQILEKTGIPRHKLYYLEQKGYIKPKRVPAGDLESREYTKKDLLMVELIWKYLKMGFKHRAAHQKAQDELGSPAKKTAKKRGA